jgi:PhzF family phenazine biosynthesis protein
MRTFSYKKIDAFTSNGSAGNPAACLYLETRQALTPNDMLAVAKQHKGFVSEMVYCEPSAIADVKLTYYSSECEVDFCGHGTIACLYDLASRDPRLACKPEIIIETNRKGLLAVSNRIQEQNAVFITAPEAIHLGTTLTPEQIAAALGLSEDRLSSQTPIDVINAGLATLIVPIAELDDEISVFPDEARLKAFCESQGIDIILIFSMQTAHTASHAHTRVFAPRFGYLEDPATGSGNSAFGFYMLKHGLWDGSPIRIEQGGKDRIFNTVHLAAQNGRVLFGGSATVRISGEYYL